MHCVDAQMAITLNIIYVILDASTKLLVPLTIVQFKLVQRVGIPFSCQMACLKRFSSVNCVEWCCV
jgi:hypothetical protein